MSTTSGGSGRFIIKMTIAGPDLLPIHSASEQASARKTVWFAAMRWRRRVEAALEDVGLTFTQWLVLEAARELIAEADDAVIQNEIAARVELDRSTVAQVMIKLEMKDLVSRDIDMTGRALRIWLTTDATQLLDEHCARIEAASASHFDDPLIHPNKARRAPSSSDFDDWP